MEIRYRFDPERFRLGKLCKHGHRWPGTDQSLRRGHDCVGCGGAKQRDWLISFIDYEALALPDRQTLGKLCPKQHRWNGLNTSLRFDRRCLECEREKGGYLSEEQKQSLAQEYKKRASERRKRYKARVREQLRQKGLTARGTPVVSPGRQRLSLGLPEDRRLYNAIRNAGKLPTVARLVAAEQRRYWTENPEAKAEHDRLLAQVRWRARYQINHHLRLYTREKSKRRKAQARGQTPLQIPVAAIKRRFAEFGNSCAYCSITGDMNLEHVIAISKGGPHDIGNIVPACFSCNMSKGTKPMEQWYRQQPFFNEVRLQQIRRVMRRPEGVQLQLSCGC
ncbi:MAG: HNH endonuclease signature motif containing protein [Cyanobacteriota bacterium]|nr:HNH endonuclease signature motif containing protein [Cyanobacteriota bacterium]